MRLGNLKQPFIFIASALVGLYGGARLNSIGLYEDFYANLMIAIVGCYILLRHGVDKSESVTFALGLAVGISSYEYLFVTHNPTTPPSSFELEHFSNI